MSVKDFFASRQGGKISQKRFGAKYGKDKVMSEMLGNRNIASTLDSSAEKAEFHSLMKEASREGLTKTEMKEILGRGMAGKLRTLSKKEAYAITKEFFGDEKVRYILPEYKRVTPSVSRRNVKSNIGNGPGRNVQAKVTKFAPLGLRMSVYQTNSRKEDTQKDEKSGFFRAIRAVQRNKH